LTNHEITHNTVVKSSYIGCESAGGESAPPQVLICWKPEQNPGKNGAQRCSTSKNDTQVCRKTH